MPKIFNVINRERLCAAFLLFNFGYFASQAVKTFNDPTPPPLCSPVTYQERPLNLFLFIF